MVNTIRKLTNFLKTGFFFSQLMVGYMMVDTLGSGNHINVVIVTTPENNALKIKF